VKQKRAIVGFYRDKGKTKPITQSVAWQKKIVAKTHRFKGVAPSNEVTRLAQKELSILRKYSKKIELAGSIRRRKPNPSDIDFVIIPRNDAAKQAIYKHAEKYKIRARGTQLLSYWLLPRKRAQVDIYFAEPKHYGAMLLFATGPGDYNIALRKKAIVQGLKLNQYGVWKGNRCKGSRTEQDIYKALGKDFKSPELRGLTDSEICRKFGVSPGTRVLKHGEKTHTHWMAQGKTQTRKTHRISLIHKDVFSRLRHGMETGDFNSFYKKNFTDDFKRLKGAWTDKHLDAYEAHVKNTVIKFEV